MWQSNVIYKVQNSTNLYVIQYVKLVRNYFRIWRWRASARRASKGWRNADFTDMLRQIIWRGAAVSASPLLGMPVGSISTICASPMARGRCCTPRGTTYS
jgi:hypothetical protein